MKKINKKNQPTANAFNLFKRKPQKKMYYQFV